MTVWFVEMSRIIKYTTKEKATANKKKDDRLFYDPYLNEYFTISPRKKPVWNEDEFEENFLVMPETFEECKSLRSGNCQDCEYFPQRMGGWKSCRRRTTLSNRGGMEIFD
jgi:hypothetical protein